jgi:sugar transferase (PEP-CTERM/EpsH1 system associated)
MAPSPTDNQLHLMQVIHSLQQGGSERLACDLARRLDPSRFRSSVCALDLGGPLANELKNAAVSCHVVGRRPGFDWPLILRLNRFFRRERVDLVQTHHLTQLIYSGIGARLAGAALVHVEHDYFSLMLPKARGRLRALAPLCHQVVAVGDEIRAFLLREVNLRPSQVIVIRNGVDVTQYSPQRRVPRERLGLPTEGRLIGHVARLEAEKSQETLLRAFRIVLSTYADARLELVGDGSLRGDLEKVARSLGIAKRVDFLGLRKDVADLLPHWEVFVLSSVREGLPLAVLEAMACARPVVATAVGEIPQVLCNGATGLTVPPGDPAALAASISAVLETPEWAAAIGRAARRLIEEKFSLDFTVKRYQALYETLPCRNNVRRYPTVDQRE